MRKAATGAIGGSLPIGRASSADAASHRPKLLSDVARRASRRGPCARARSRPYCTRARSHGGSRGFGSPRIDEVFPCPTMTASPTPG
jgi:hypothetical protein